MNVPSLGRIGTEMLGDGVGIGLSCGPARHSIIWTEWFKSILTGIVQRIMLKKFHGEHMHTIDPHEFGGSVMLAADFRS